MTLASRFISVILSLGLLFLIIELVRRNKLKEKYAILWLITGVFIFMLAAFERLLYNISALFGITMPINAIFFFGIFFIVLMSLHFSITVSKLGEENKKLARKVSLLETKINHIEQK